MGRTLRFTNKADSFVQGGNANNVALNLFMRGGNDKVDLNRTDDLGGANFVNAGSGNDTVINRIESGSLILLGSGNDRYFSVGFGSFSSDRADTVRGGGGDDLIAVQTFKSSYFGNAGNDTFVTVGFQNSYNGGAGNDTIDYSERDFDSTQGGSGVTVDLAANKALTSATRAETIKRIENVIGSGANDDLFGKNNANKLTGGEGFDQLVGRGGADTFIWRNIAEAEISGSEIDFISDFNAAQRDKIDLRGIDANELVKGNQAFQYINEADFTGKAGQLRVEAVTIFDGTNTNDLILLGDVDGDGQADFRIGLFDVQSLSASSLFL